MQLKLTHGQIRLTSTRCLMNWPLRSTVTPCCLRMPIPLLRCGSPIPMYTMPGIYRLFGNCCENETGFNTPPNVFNDLAGQARGFCSRFHGNSQRAQKTTRFSTSHEQPPRLLALSPSLIVAAPNFLQNLWPGTLGKGLLN